MAHSLGNMVVASAIADHGMQVSKYFMFNAAIPAEAFDATQWSTNLQTSAALIPSAWVDYPVLSWCATWHTFFGNADDRFKLKWLDRFSTIPTTVLYNYYSSGDNVLGLSADGPPGILTGVISDWGRYAWNKQEVFKGVGCVAGTTWAGWGFARNAPESTMTHSQMYMTAQDVIATNTISPETFINWPVFRPTPSEMYSSNIEISVCNEILAKGIPALSGPSGSKSMSILAQDRDRDMNSISRPNGWPRISGDFAGLWLHCDLKDVSFFYNHKLFAEIVTKGELK